MGKKGNKSSNIFQVLKSAGAWQTKDGTKPIITKVGTIGEIKSPLKYNTLLPSTAKQQGAGTNTGAKSAKDEAKAAYVKEGGKATGKMKDYALNSQERRDEYEARGWKQDKTTEVAKKADDDVKKTDDAKVDETPKVTDNTKKVEDNTKKLDEAKVNLKSTRKDTRIANRAARKERRAGRKATRIANRTARKEGRATRVAAEGGTRVGNALRGARGKVKTAVAKAKAGKDVKAPSEGVAKKAAPKAKADRIAKKSTDPMVGKSGKMDTYADRKAKQATADKARSAARTSRSGSKIASKKASPAKRLASAKRRKVKKSPLKCPLIAMAPAIMGAVGAAKSAKG